MMLFKVLPNAIDLTLTKGSAFAKNFGDKKMKKKERYLEIPYLSVNINQIFFLDASN